MAAFSRWTKGIVICGGVLAAALVAVAAFTGDYGGDSELARIRNLQDSRDIAGLESVARTADTRVARKAVAAMGRLDAPAVAPLVKLVQSDQRPEIRAKAAITLNQVISKGVIEQKDAQQALVDAAKSDSDPNVRAAALTTLGHTRAFEAMPTVLDGLEDDDVNVRRAAYQSVYKILRVRFLYRADDPPEKRQQVVKMIRGMWSDPGARKRVEEYYKGRFKEIYKKHAR